MYAEIKITDGVKTGDFSGSASSYRIEKEYNNLIEILHSCLKAFKENNLKSELENLKRFDETETRFAMEIAKRDDIKKFVENGFK